MTSKALRDLLAERAGRTPSAVDLGAVLSTVRTRADARSQRARNLRSVAFGAALVAIVLAGIAVLVPEHSAAQNLQEGRSAGLSSGQAPHTTLVAIEPAPPAAETSIGLVPNRWSYLGHQGPTTLYVPPKLRHSSLGDFQGKFIVDVHNRILPDYPHRLTINGYSASYSASNGGQFVDIIYRTKIDIGIQIPAGAHLTRKQALRLAGTLDVRSTKIRSSG